MTRLRLLVALAAATTLSSVSVFAVSAVDQPAAPLPDARAAAKTVFGPGERELIAQGEPGELDLVRIASSDTEGSVVGANRNFKTSRLPATFGAVITNGETCTATLIGPQVILTAAHCVDRKMRDASGNWLSYGGKLSNADGAPLAHIRGCAMAAAYLADEPKPGRPRNEQDYALCDLLTPISTLLAETIAIKPETVAAGSRLVLVGYGCTDEDLVNGQIVAGMKGKGRLNVGENQVTSGGPAGWLSVHGKVGTTQAVLCPGDSGGAAFANASLAPGVGNDSGWRIVAVNSAVGRLKGGAPEDYVSYLAPLADPAFASFVKAWMAERPTVRHICGVTVSHLNEKCRP